MTSQKKAGSYKKKNIPSADFLEPRTTTTNSESILSERQKQWIEVTGFLIQSSLFTISVGSDNGSETGNQAEARDDEIRRRYFCPIKKFQLDADLTHLPSDAIFSCRCLIKASLQSRDKMSWGPTTWGYIGVTPLKTQVQA